MSRNGPFPYIERPAAWAKETACGVVSLRRHCPDQVPGGRRSASELSPASQPFLPAPDLPRHSVRSSSLDHLADMLTLHGAYDGRLGSKARPARAKRRVSPKPAASRDGGPHASRSCPQGHSLAVSVGGPCREPIDFRTVTLSVPGRGFLCDHRTRPITDVRRLAAKAPLNSRHVVPQPLTASTPCCTFRSILEPEAPPEAIKNPSEAIQRLYGCWRKFRPPALQRGGSVVLEPADQLGGGVVGGYLAGQPDVDLDRGLVIRADVNGVGPAEDRQPDRLTDQQAGRSIGPPRPIGPAGLSGLSHHVPL